MTDFLERWAGESETHAKLVAEELLIAEVTEAIWQALKEANIDRTELARRMGTSKGYVSQVLNGSRNMTLRTLADICRAIGQKPVFQLKTASHGETYRMVAEVPVLQKPSKLRYLREGNTIYPQDVWTAAA